MVYEVITSFTEVWAVCERVPSWWEPPVRSVLGPGVAVAQV